MYFSERTRELLFSGSKRSFEIPKDANCNNIYVEEESPMESDVTECPRQLQITAAGLLVNPAAEGRPVNALEAMMIARRGLLQSCLFSWI